MRFRNNQSARTLVLSAILVALALVLSLADTVVSSVFPFLPGFKLGLANIVTLFALYYLGFRQSLVINVLRCLLAALLSGFLTALFFSLAGGLLSLAVMALFHKRISIVKASVLGAVAHNMAQAAVAFWLTGTPQVVYYIPFLVVAGAVSGFITGIVCNLLLNRFNADPKLAQ